MSKSLKQRRRAAGRDQAAGADILRLWVCQTDYWDDQRIGPEILKTTVEAYRKLRNTIRWMLGSLAHFHDDDRVPPARMPELERLMLHRLAELDAQVRQDYADFDYKRIVAALNTFMTVDLSAFYFDIRKDALYCDPISSLTRRACLTVIDHLFRCTVTWLAPMLPFTAEEAWLTRYPSEDGSVHLEQFPHGARRMAQRCARREVAQGAHGAQRGDRRAGDRAGAQAHRLFARSRAHGLCLRHGAFRRDGRRRPRRNRHHLRAPNGRGRGPGGRLPPRPTSRVSRSRCGSPKDASARGRGRSCRRSATIRTIRTYRRATRGRCASGTPCARPPNDRDALGSRSPASVSPSPW